jgi:hypothetical protein
MDIEAGILLVECLFMGVEFVYDKLFLKSRTLNTPAIIANSYTGNMRII